MNAAPTRPLRVVMACVRYPPAPGGAEDHVAALSEGLVARGHEVIVHTTDLHKEVPFERRDLPTEINGVRIVRHRAYTPGRALHYTIPPSMWGALRKDAADADVLHAHSYGYFQTTATARAARRAGKPFVFTPHYHPAWSMEGGRARRLLRAIYDPTLGRAALDAADRIICVSSGELASLASDHRIDPEKVRLVPNGFHAARFDPPPTGAAFRDLAGIPEAAPLVVYAGRLASNKGLDHLLRAFARLSKAVPGARLALTGEDQGRRAGLQALAQSLGVAEHVSFPGHLPAGAYRSALAAADVFVLPSEWEAFGIVLLEAMACGVPCIATRVGGAPDVVVDGETGRLVPYGDAEALAAALSGILGDGETRRRMGDAGRRRAFGAFAWERVVDRTLGVYSELT